MGMLDSGLKQRMVGALVLMALAVIFLPMLLNRSDELRHVTVDAPQIPAEPAPPRIELQSVDVPEPQAAQAPAVDDSMPVDELPPPITDAPGAPEPATQAQASVPTPAATPPAEPAAPEQHLDADKLPLSWSIQLAALSNRGNAESLQKTLRSEGYNAYIRSAGNINRVFVGPLVERADADRLRDQLERQHKLKGMVVRFEPERS